jgi:hypothetical protein
MGPLTDSEYSCEERGKRSTMVDDLSPRTITH